MRMMPKHKRGADSSPSFPFPYPFPHEEGAAERCGTLFAFPFIRSGQGGLHRPTVPSGHWISKQSTRLPSPPTCGPAPS